MSSTAQHELDTSGLNCPLPILKTKRAMLRIASGERIHVISTDPASMEDFRAFSEQTGHPLLVSEERSGAFHFIIEKS
jgi:tRNA 2-thiouridine synthesizing protein A